MLKPSLVSQAVAKAVATAEPSHARFSPSSAERWMACPGSISAQEAMGPQTEDDSSPASRKGTAAHSLLEICIILNCEPEAFRGMVMEAGCPKVDQPMIDGVRIALDWLQEYCDEHGAENLIIVPERRVAIGPMIGLDEVECSGTSDLMIAHRDFSKLVVADYKNGMWSVSPKDNPQLMLYTAGGLYELQRGAAEAGVKPPKFKSFSNVIIQPNAAKRRAVEGDEFKPSKLTVFLREAERAAGIAKMPDAPRSAGTHCKFCRAADNCNTFRRRARAVASDEFGEYLDPEQISDEQMEDVLDEADILQTWINSVKIRALKLAVAGKAEFTRYEVGFGKRTRKFADLEEVAEWCKSKKIPLDVYNPRTMLSPAQLEAELKRLKIGAEKRRNDLEKPMSPIERFVSYSVPNPVLKKRGSKDAADDFDEVK